MGRRLVWFVERFGRESLVVRSERKKKYGHWEQTQEYTVFLVDRTGHASQRLPLLDYLAITPFPIPHRLRDIADEPARDLHLYLTLEFCIHRLQAFGSLPV
jgi:hypothetical protein